MRLCANYSSSSLAASDDISKQHSVKVSADRWAECTASSGFGKSFEAIWVFDCSNTTFVVNHVFPSSNFSKVSEHDNIAFDAVTVKQLAETFCEYLSISVIRDLWGSMKPSIELLDMAHSSAAGEV